MKKIISIILLISVMTTPFSLKASESVSVSAVVWNINQAPRILSVNPSSNPRLLEVWETQNFTISLTDNEKDTIYYTITPKDWYSNPISWVINPQNYNNDGIAYINFLYLAPASIQSDINSEIIVTLNDWPNVITRKINLYIYQ